ncbi:MAG TPA: beta-ketoacyl-ACP synthase II [Anaerolineae bacterium]|nr:beta-ketoacyl-ACP synthase II [Anaerolineae bacterium]
MGTIVTACPGCGAESPDGAKFCFMCGLALSGGRAARPTRRVVITGLGAVTPVGLTAEETWQGLLEGRSGVSLITEINVDSYPTKIGGIVREFDPGAHMDRKEARRMGRYCQLAVAAAGMALEDAGLAQGKFDSEAIGVILGTSGGGAVEECEKACRILLSKGGMRISPFFPVTVSLNVAAHHVSYIYGLDGYSSTVVTACASGTQAIGEAAEVIRRGAAEIMVAGGTESGICELSIAAFSVARGYSRRNDEPEKASRPFDLDRDGFVPAEGAGIVVLEALEHALSRGARIYAEIMGYAGTADTYHLIAPDPEGKAQARAMVGALRDAGLCTEDVDYINAHATSTPLGDVAETVAIKRAFGDRAYRVPISATKSMTGHLIGAAGGVEAIASVLTIRDQMIHPTINLDQPDPECDLDYVAHVARQAKVDVVLSNSFGLGGQNACLVIGRYRD